MPTELEPGVLYLSEEFGTAAHLCPCGCGSKVRTPLGPTEWSFVETRLGPSLNPSVGNWQQPCRSHYWIDRGEIRWAAEWSNEQIEDGRRREQLRRASYYDEIAQPAGALARLWHWLRSRLGA
jgi:hypothetical protein